MIDKPHNNFFLTVFSNRKMMVDLVTQLLPDVAEQIVIDSLELDDTSYIDKELQELYSDIVYNCVSKDGEKTKVTLLFEHKSNPVQYPTLQLADYIFSIFRNNIRNKQPLSLVVPIIFYHGKTPWKYKELKDYFQNSNTFFQPYIPNFKYHVIDLTQYSDEDILSLRMSFLINSLIALKHKNDSEYVKKQPKRIFWGFEIYENTADMELLFHSLAVYIISSTNLKGKEMVEIIDTLPKESQERAKTTYENILEEGILIGEKRNEGQIKEREKIGEKRGRELTKINMAFDALKMGLEAPFVVKYFKLPKRLVEAFAKCIEDNFETTAFNTILANEIFRNFGYIRSKDIVNLTQLEMELLEKLEKNATRPKDNEENK